MLHIARFTRSVFFSGDDFEYVVGWLAAIGSKWCACTTHMVCLLASHLVRVWGVFRSAYMDTKFDINIFRIQKVMFVTIGNL